MVKANREERTRIGKHLKALRRVLDVANKPKYDSEKMVAEEKKLEELKAANQTKRALIEQKRIKAAAKEEEEAAKEAAKVAKKNEAAAKEAAKARKKEDAEASEAKSSEAVAADGGSDGNCR